MITIINTEQDLAGKWRVDMDCDGVRRQFKFEKEPDGTTAIAEAERVIALEIQNAANQAAADEAARRKAIIDAYNELMGL